MAEPQSFWVNNIPVHNKKESVIAEQMRLQIRRATGGEVLFYGGYEHGLINVEVRIDPLYVSTVNEILDKTVWKESAA